MRAGHRRFLLACAYLPSPASLLYLPPPARAAVLIHIAGAAPQGLNLPRRPLPSTTPSPAQLLNPPIVARRLNPTWSTGTTLRRIFDLSDETPSVVHGCAANPALAAGRCLRVHEVHTHRACLDGVVRSVRYHSWLLLRNHFLVHFVLVFLYFIFWLPV